MIQLTRQFALFKQTVLNDTRSSGLQLLRFLFALFLGVIVYFAQSEASRWREMDGRYLFEILFLANMIFVLFACLFLFLPLIKEEREENTLGMILMTGITPFAYLTGRIGSRLMMFVLMLGVQIPIIYLCVTMGGIDIPTIMLAYAFLLLIAIYLSNAFVLGSLLCSNIFTGVFISAGISLIFIYFYNFILSEAIDLRHAEEPFILIEETLEYIFSIRKDFADESILYYTFAFLVSCGALFFLTAVYFFNVLAEEQEELEIPAKLKGAKSSSEKAESLKGKGLKPIYRKLRTKRFGSFPIIYKDFRFTSFGPLLYVLQFATICYLFYEVGSNNQYGFRDNFFDWLYEFSRDCIPTLVIMSGAVISFCSNMLFASEIKHKTLGSLLMLPNDHIKIYWYKTLCTMRIAAPSIIALTALFFIYLIIGIDMKYRYYEGASYYYKQGLLILTLLIPAYFINTYLSLVFTKYSFFLAGGVTFGWFFLHILFFEFTKMSMGEGVAVLTVTGTIASLFCYFRSISKISGHSISS